MQRAARAQSGPAALGWEYWFGDCLEPDEIRSLAERNEVVCPNEGQRFTSPCRKAGTRDEPNSK